MAKSAKDIVGLGLSLSLNEFSSKPTVDEVLDTMPTKLQTADMKMGLRKKVYNYGH